jgi:hypothetical protein
MSTDSLSRDAVHSGTAGGIRCGGYVECVAE